MENKPILKQKGRYGLQYRGVECTNCSHPLDVSDKYCPNCSQANSTKKLSLKDFIDEFFASLISYDSRLLKTFTALLTKPGKITHDYIKGKRVSYTNPFRFLLSLSIIYFLMINFSNNISDLDKYGAGKQSSFFDKISSVNISDEIIKLDSIEIKNDDRELLRTLDTLNVIPNINRRDSIMMADPTLHLNKLKKKPFLERFGAKREFFTVLLEKKDIYGFDEIPPDYEIDDSRENQYAFNAAKSVYRFKQQPGSFLSSVISRLPFVIFFFLPVFAFFIWLAYIRKKHTFTEHLIFGFHIQSLLFILLIISFLVDSIFNIFTGWLFFLIFGVYLFLSMKMFYKQGFFKTIVKYVFLNTIFFILAMFATVILLVGSAFTY
ncbi:DUF3667 domain-containing protein [Maribacter algarum]|uniref:DUF3667 domain-containing protein n=1 Tax=Maribacter algarum (ex Zhang et al. 2020) TaxID=2578118 RepID=A0A5S3PNV6_9FLAO|nr:DUF3667 domain-containing protein [Maribacter algarum]TMM56154.1 DUF3667 domain-containing protein [Maribacter algarum]